ncbi:MAG: DUF3108 domain-containing protein [Bdellovibrionales bacterium]
MTQPKALRRLSMVWAAICLLCPVFSDSALAAPESRQKLVYEVYASGIHAVQATLDLKISANNRYDIVLDAHTRGLLGKLAPWDGSFETHGWWDKNGDHKPQQHKSVGTWRGETQTKDYAYGRDGAFKSLTIIDDGQAPEIRAIEKEVTDDTIDALTAALKVFETYNQAGTCKGQSKVFDGKRSFTQQFVHKAAVRLEQSKYNIYTGPAAECTVEVTPLKGAWADKPRGWLSIQEQGRERGTLPTVWLASIEDGAPAVPVKIRVKTAYGTLFMHLAEYQSDGKFLVAEKRVK